MDEQKIKELTDLIAKNSLDYQAEVKRIGADKLDSSAFKAFQEKNIEEFNKFKDELALLKTPKLNAKEEKAEQSSLEMKAFDSALRGYVLTPEEQKAIRRYTPEPGERKVLTIADPTTGGYLAPPEFVQQIIKGETEFSPVRSIANVRQTSYRSVQIPKRTTLVTAAWTTEQGTRTESTGPAYGMVESTPHEMYAFKDVSFQDLEDSAFNLEGELAAEFSESFGVLEGTAFVSGSAVGQPEGLLTNATIVASYTTTSTASTGTFDAASVVSGFYALKSAYSRNSSWLLNRAIIGVMRGWTDSTSGQFLWMPGLTAGTPDTLLGRPIVEATDMAAAQAGSAKMLLLGDFKRGYQIVDRIQVAITRDPFTQAASGNIRFHARKRVDGMVVLPEAFRVVRCSA
jgi:HK97 family phage major capsid protein